MKAIEFPEVNVRIAENQPEYETLPANVQPDEQTKGFFNQVTFCFELDEEEKKQIAETGTGQVWHTVLMPIGAEFHPIRMSTLKPTMSRSKEEKCTHPEYVIIGCPFEKDSCSDCEYLKRQP